MAIPCKSRDEQWRETLRKIGDAIEQEFEAAEKRHEGEAQP